MKYIYLFSVLLFLLASCEEVDINRAKSVGEKPMGIDISKVESEPYSGGAKITFQYPDSKDILYAKIKYKLADGKVWEQKTSIYKNVFEVYGFADKGTYDVQLSVVAKGDVESDPVNYTIEVDTPSYKKVFSTLEMESGLGGVKVRFENHDKAQLQYYILKFDSLKNSLQEAQISRTTLESGNISLRGCDTIPTLFGIYIKDRWGNCSDTISSVLKPLFEKKIVTKNVWSRYDICTDNVHEANEPHTWSGRARPITNLFDGYKDNENCYQSKPNEPALPQWFTIDMKYPTTFSRFVMFQRTWYADIYFMCPRYFELWGSNNPTPNSPAEGSDFDSSWTLIGEFESIKPSGLPLNQYTADDKAYATKGEEYDIPNCDYYRYLRFKTLDTWMGVMYVGMSELEFYGDVKMPNN